MGDEVREVVVSGAAERAEVPKDRCECDEPALGAAGEFVLEAYNELLLRGRCSIRLPERRAETPCNDVISL